MAQSRNINIIPNSAITRVHVSQGDIGRTIYFNLYEGSIAYTPTSGDVIKCVGTKPSGLGFTVTCSWSGNVVTCVTTEEMTDESGSIDAELVITSSDETTVLGTSNFKLCIEKNPHPETTTDGNMETLIPELTLLVNEIEGTYHAYGSPWVASTVAEMTDTDKIYVYTGSETGYVNGNWYYHNGSSWVSGGVYNSVAVQTDTTLSVSGMAADAEAVGDEINQIFTTDERSVSIADISGVTEYADMSAAAGQTAIILTSNSNYDTYTIIPTEDVEIWFDNPTVTYLAVCVGGTYVSTSTTDTQVIIYCGSATRYRNTDNNLPTENSKLTISAGCLVTFTVTADQTDYVYGLNNVTVVQKSFREAAEPKCLIQYFSTSGSDSSSEYAYIYTPINNGFIRYTFVHTISAGINSDVWRVGYAYHVDTSLSNPTQLTTTGEWECAIKISGRSDFSGGYLHGDEVMTNIVFMIDGTPTDITTLTDLTECSEISIFEISDLYDPDDSATIYAEHGSEHLFNNEGLTIRQSVLFTLSETISSAYMAMFPIAKTVSDTVITNSSFTPLVADDGINASNTNKAIIYKTDGNVKASFSVPVFEAFDGGDFAFWCLDNGSDTYNKCYYVNASSAVSVTANKLYLAESRYSFVIG